MRVQLQSFKGALFLMSEVPLHDTIAYEDRLAWHVGLPPVVRGMRQYVLTTNLEFDLTVLP